MSYTYVILSQFHIYMFTVERVQRWYRYCRTEYSRLKKASLKRSGSSPEKLAPMKQWIWDNWKFLWDVIVTKNQGIETQVGICNHYIDDFWCVHESSSSSSSCVGQPITDIHVPLGSKKSKPH